MTAIHLAAQYGHVHILETLKEYVSLDITSKKVSEYEIVIKERQTFTNTCRIL